jgi:hypothetical protein
VEFNVHISQLESGLQDFINRSFENITSIEASLSLLKKFQSILQRENLRSGEFLPWRVFLLLFVFVFVFVFVFILDVLRFLFVFL